MKMALYFSILSLLQVLCLKELFIVYEPECSSILKS